MKVNIRFLKAGLVTFEVPDGTSLQDIKELGKEKLDSMSDQELVLSMSDCIPCGINPSRFDTDSFQVEAIELPNTELEYDYYTDLWKAYVGFTD